MTECEEVIKTLLNYLPNSKRSEELSTVITIPYDYVMAFSVDTNGFIKIVFNVIEFIAYEIIPNKETKITISAIDGVYRWKVNAHVFISMSEGKLFLSFMPFSP